ncbi:hypothetical protein QTP88_012341 [Uroleucon formosanum]
MPRLAGSPANRVNENRTHTRTQANYIEHVEGRKSCPESRRRNVSTNVTNLSTLAAEYFNGARRTSAEIFNRFVMSESLHIKPLKYNRNP